MTSSTDIVRENLKLIWCLATNWQIWSMRRTRLTSCSMTQLTAYQKKRAQQLSKSKQFLPIPFKSQNQGSQGSYKGKNRNYYASRSQSQAQGNFQSFCIHHINATPIDSNFSVLLK
ncbi:unnamed protein product [Rhizophagus irregularis]|nr:unnamed protein product [Rhizophagus irregularis]